jgi:hypothetical protein
MSFGHSKLIIYSLIAFVIAFSISFSMTAANTNDAPKMTGAEEWPVHDMERPQPTMVNPGNSGSAKAPGTAPSDAVVLLGPGTGMKHWNHDAWKVDADGVAQVTPGSGDVKTKESFGDCQFHVEWLIPADRECDGQAGSNSGVFFLDKYEVQILGSNPNQTYPDGQAGSMYGQYPPLVNPCRPNGEWNSYDIIFTAPRFKSDGSLDAAGTVTVIFNGVVVQNHSTFMGITAHGSKAEYEKHDPTGQIRLQDHGDPIKFANIWIRPLAARTLAW